MPLVSRNISALFNGVSQQPPPTRHSSQWEAQVNARSSVADGVMKRPPFQHVAKIATTPTSAAYIHTINRDTAERYVVTITNGDLVVHGIDGTSKTVAFPNGKTYLNATSPKSDFAVITVADYTIIANKTVTVAMEAGLSGGTYKGAKQLFSDLPTTGNVDGDLWEITGDPSSDYDTFYVKYNATKAVWEETLKNGIPYRLDAATMPHLLVREANGSFTFKRATWDDRLVGDTLSAPNPSFVGNKIKTIFFHRDRLGLAVDEGVVLSETSSYFNFFRVSATVLADTDPIDVTASHVKVSIIDNVVPFNKALLLFSGLTQFVLHSNDLPLSLRTIVIDSATDFEVSPGVSPVGVGANVYFAVPRGANIGVYEYYVDTNNVQHDANDATAHVPRYIPKNTYKFAVADSFDMLLALSSDEPRRIYVYSYFWVGKEKVQSSWSYWELPTSDTVLNIDFIEGTLYAVISRADGTYLDKLQLSGDEAEASMGFVVHLDRRARLTGTYDSVADKTTWTLPYSDSGSMQAVLSGDFPGRKGEIITTTRPSNTTIEATGNYSTGQVYVGRVYEQRLQFSTQYLREIRGDNEVSVVDGRLQLRTMSITYAQTGYFRAEVSKAGREPASYVFTGKVLGSYVLGTPPVRDGTFRFSVGGRNLDTTITLINDSPYPSRFLSADWEALYTARAKRV